MHSIIFPLEILLDLDIRLMFTIPQLCSFQIYSTQKPNQKH